MNTWWRYKCVRVFACLRTLYPSSSNASGPDSALLQPLPLGLEVISLESGWREERRARLMLLGWRLYRGAGSWRSAFSELLLSCWEEDNREIACPRQKKYLMSVWGFLPNDFDFACHLMDMIYLMDDIIFGVINYVYNKKRQQIIIFEKLELVNVW